MKVSVIQRNAGDNREANLEQAERLVRAAAERDRPGLVALPELFAFIGGTLERPRAAAERVPTVPACDLLGRLDRQHGIHLHGGSLIEKEGDRFYNTSMVFSPSGEITAKYRKIHLFDVTTPGRRPSKIRNRRGIVKIARIQAYNLKNIPIETPPFRKVPNIENALLVAVETDDGLVGWAVGGYAHAVMVDFINRHVAPVLVGEDPHLIERIRLKMQKQFNERWLGRVFTTALACIDIALWDIKGKALGMPVHHLLGGARDRIPVYITHGAAYHGAPVYSEEELAAEAAHLVKLGNRHLKNTVGRQAGGPNPDDDYRRMKAMRDAVGPDVLLAMDGAWGMTAMQAVRLCRLTEELNISFLEEPVLGNDPLLLAEVRSKTIIPIAAAENERFSSRDYLTARAIDILQPNVCNDGGYTAGVRIAAMAKAYNTPIGHGNGNGPHNIALHAGLPNGTIVEYHFHKWMLYNAMFEEVPQPTDGYLLASQKPGVGLEPRAGLIKEFEAKSSAQ